MMRFTILAGLVNASLFTLVAQENVILIDRLGSPVVGAENILMIHRNLSSVENSVLRTRWFEEDALLNKIIGLTYRGVKTVFLDNVIDHFTLMVDHDFFGHGWRAREYSFQNITYKFAVAPPYSSGYGLVTWNYLRERVNTLDEITSTYSAGVEASTVLANILRLKWLQTGRINHRESFLYGFAANDLTGYVLATKTGLRKYGPNDVLNYLFYFNLKEGSLVGEDVLTLDDLSRDVFINAFNPFQYFSLYAYFVTYLWSGEEDFEFPMIDLNGVKYLPSFRVGLTPFGSEVYFENLVVASPTIMNFYFRQHLSSPRSYYGGGFQGSNFFNLCWFELDIKVDVWTQPPLYIGGQREEYKRRPWRINIHNGLDPGWRTKYSN